MRQQTLKQPFSFAGVGIHTGMPAQVTVLPAPPGAGRAFQLGNTRVPAQTAFVLDTRRCTTLGIDSVRVHTVEHLLSALHGLNVDNALIVVDGPEIPILDGSALPYVKLVRAAGIELQDEPVFLIRPSEATTWSEDGAAIRVSPASQFQVEVTVSFDNWYEGSAAVGITMDSNDDQPYAMEVAPARTFAFRHEVDALLEAGLAKGGSLDNALIITPPATFSTPLRLPSEWAAHKLLDVIGDLALLDARPQLRLTIERPGHRINTRVADRLRRQEPAVRSDSSSN